MAWYRNRKGLSFFEAVILLGSCRNVRRRQSRISIRIQQRLLSPVITLRQIEQRYGRRNTLCDLAMQRLSKKKKKLAQLVLRHVGLTEVEAITSLRKT